MEFFRRRKIFADPIPLPSDLTGFADKVGRLEHEHETAGYLYLKQDVLAEKHKGEPYGKPYEVLEINAVTVDPSGEVTEYVQAIYDEAEAQHQLTAGLFRLRGTDYNIVWLDDAKAAAVLAEFF
ncbi:hypothetical protein ACIA8G_21255 [Lentzea sp. NPDC051213]|uniref:hypothetical protein n=1 Tax=Lentzea sp. NPDC051213 TaxID=3364126 RepID=UPI0037A8EC75